MMNDECVRNTRKRESGRGLFFEVAAGNADEVGGEAGEFEKVSLFAGGLGGEVDFEMLEEKMIE